MRMLREKIHAYRKKRRYDSFIVLVPPSQQTNHTDGRQDGKRSSKLGFGAMDTVLEHESQSNFSDQKEIRPPTLPADEQNSDKG